MMTPEEYIKHRFNILNSDAKKILNIGTDITATLFAETLWLKQYWTEYYPLHRTEPVTGE